MKGVARCIVLPPTYTATPPLAADQPFSLVPVLTGSRECGLVMLCVRAAPVDEVWGHREHCQFIGGGGGRRCDDNTITDLAGADHAGCEQRVQHRLKKSGSSLTSMVFGGLTFRWYRRHNNKQR